MGEAEEARKCTPSWVARLPSSIEAPKAHMVHSHNLDPEHTHATER